MATPARPSTCEAIEGCTLPIDVIFQSSDSRLLGAHSKNLESFADVFPLSGSTSHSDVVPLAEKGDTLLIFLKFTHNHPAPDLSGLDIDSLLDLAEMANKYCNYFALTACRQPMRMLASKSAENALKILRFKAIHRDLEGIDKIAARTMEYPILHVAQDFGEHHTYEFTVWIKFQQQWKEVVSQYRSHLKSMPFNCAGFTSFHQPGFFSPCAQSAQVVMSYKAAYEDELPSLARFDSRFDSRFRADPSHSRCKALPKWCEEARKILQTVPTWKQCMLW
ncbi:hypothetical protein L218DRAFT_737708 [Marasmius fiardii PR-910]|nr:hypothetical protein L218DRAFT_737708 [Marasmius fiardii PR-910]